MVLENVLVSGKRASRAREGTDKRKEGRWAREEVNARKNLGTVWARDMPGLTVSTSPPFLFNYVSASEINIL